jgi:transcriptional regulator with XRE-family HTH domain
MAIMVGIRTLKPNLMVKNAVRDRNPKSDRDGDERVYLQTTQLMARLLGMRLRIARLGRAWSEAEAAERARISRATLQKIERGHPAVALGLVLELCSVLGVSITGGPLPEMRALLERAQLELAALPRRIRTQKAAPDDNF